MSVSIYSADAIAALVVNHARLLVDDGIRRVLSASRHRREVIEEAISELESDRCSCATLASKSPADPTWPIERDAYAAIIAFLRTMLPVETPTQPTEGVSAC